MKITIIGAGIAGLTTAIALNKAGFETEVFEAAPAIRPVGAGLGLAPNAMRALELLGLAEKINSLGRKLNTFRIVDRRDRPISVTGRNIYNGKYSLTLSIHRHDLHRALLEELDDKNIFLNKKAVGLQRKDNKITLSFADGTNHTTNYLIIADGINSQLRNILASEAAVKYTGYTCWRAVIKNPGIDVNDTAREYWGTEGRFGIVPGAYDTVYWFACINAKEKKQYRHFTVSDLQQAFKDFEPKVTALPAATCNEALIYDDIHDLEPLGRYAFDDILLVGDAAHATTPNMGQGACQAIEDAVVLMKEMQAHETPNSAFKAFEQKRLARTHYITKQSRSIGKLAQVDNRILASMRNFFLRLVPDFVHKQQLKKLYDVEF
jgi:2-polyprenyl-6-methoxyphenol hydroxylase-like FAD-dependent oxidoreductase